MPDPLSAAIRRRLADDPRRCWLWGLGSGVVCTGIPWLLVPGLAVMAWHAITRRTLLPAVYGLTLFGGLAFVLATLDTVLISPAQSLALGSTATPSPLLLAGVGVFAFGHRQGQEKAARNGRRWLELDR